MPHPWMRQVKHSRVGGGALQNLLPTVLYSKWHWESPRSREMSGGHRGIDRTLEAQGQVCVACEAVTELAFMFWFGEDCRSQNWLAYNISVCIWALFCSLAALKLNFKKLTFIWIAW